MKSCSRCKVSKSLDEFYRRARDGHQSLYKPCKKEAKKENRSDRHAKKIQATPSWADLEKIKQIYLNCPKSHHVDHIIPLQGKNVRGLHVDYNLQYLPARENIRKGNRLAAKVG